MLPQVTVLQAPKKLYELPPLLLRMGLFDTLHITEEDRNRARLYQGENQRKGRARRLRRHRRITRYSLQTTAVIHRASAAEMARIAQLTQKTNQFNLTTRRYAEPEVQSLANDPDGAVYSLSADRFGALGLVGVLFIRFSGDVAHIDTFLMSCRALGRRLEIAMVAHCLADIRTRRPVQRWEAGYNPSPKNAQVADFWPRLGFIEIASVRHGRNSMRARLMPWSKRRRPSSPSNRTDPCRHPKLKTNSSAFCRQC